MVRSSMRSPGPHTAKATLGGPSTTAPPPRISTPRAEIVELSTGLTPLAMRTIPQSPGVAAALASATAARRVHVPVAVAQIPLMAASG